MKIKEYPEADLLSDLDEFVLESSSNGTLKTKASTLIQYFESKFFPTGVLDIANGGTGNNSNTSNGVFDLSAPKSNPRIVNIFYESENNSPDRIAVWKQGNIVSNTKSDFKSYLNLNVEVIWTGNWSSGSIHVPNSKDYKVFIFANNESNYVAFVAKHPSKSTLLGCGGLGSSSALSSLIFEGTYSDSDEIFNSTQGLNSIFIANHNVVSRITINKIIGLI